MKGNTDTNWWCFQSFFSKSREEQNFGNENLCQADGSFRQAPKRVGTSWDFFVAMEDFSRRSFFMEHFFLGRSI